MGVHVRSRESSGFLAFLIGGRSQKGYPSLPLPVPD